MNEAKLEDQDTRFESLYGRHSTRVFLYARRRGASISEAEDVVEEVFVICWRNLPRLNGDILPWLFGVARRVLANRRRQQQRRELLELQVLHEPSHFDSGPAKSLERKEVLALLLQGLTKLKENDREALLLIAWDGLSRAEAAQAMGCTPATFRVRLHRARNHLLAVTEQAANGSHQSLVTLLDEMEVE